MSDEAAFREAVTERFGLRLDGPGRPSFTAVLHAVSTSEGLSLARLLDLVRNAPLDAPPLRRLVHSLTNNESYFFRDPRMLEAIRDHVIPELARRRDAGRRIRIWSAGSSAGQEAYSLAILAREALGAGWSIEVVGSDIDEDVLARARARRFGRRDLRACPPGLRKRYFSERDGFYDLDDEPLRSVTFVLDSLLTPYFSESVEPFDLVLCRNVTIHLVDDAVAQVHEKLRRHVARDGVVVLGTLEARPAQGFRRAEGFPLHLAAFERAEVPRVVPESRVETVIPPARAARSRLRAVPPVALPPVELARLRVAEPESQSVVVEVATDETELIRARELADRGELERADALLAPLVARTPLDPEVYLLAAMVAQERGFRARAIELLRHALYLDSSHDEAWQRLRDLRADEDSDWRWCV